jgi:hypothetical protein
LTDIEVSPMLTTEQLQAIMPQSRECGAKEALTELCGRRPAGRVQGSSLLSCVDAAAHRV